MSYHTKCRRRDVLLAPAKQNTSASGLLNFLMTSSHQLAISKYQQEKLEQRPTWTYYERESLQVCVARNQGDVAHRDYRHSPFAGRFSLWQYTLSKSAGCSWWMYYSLDLRALCSSECNCIRLIYRKSSYYSPSSRSRDQLHIHLWIPLLWGLGDILEHWTHILYIILLVTCIWLRSLQGDWLWIINVFLIRTVGKTMNERE